MYINTRQRKQFPCCIRRLRLPRVNAAVPLRHYPVTRRYIRTALLWYDYKIDPTNELTGDHLAGLSFAHFVCYRILSGVLLLLLASGKTMWRCFKNWPPGCAKLCYSARSLYKATTFLRRLSHARFNYPTAACLSI